MFACVCVCSGHQAESDRLVGHCKWFPLQCSESQVRAWCCDSSTSSSSFWVYCSANEMCGRVTGDTHNPRVWRFQKQESNLYGLISFNLLCLNTKDKIRCRYFSCMLLLKDWSLSTCKIKCNFIGQQNISTIWQGLQLYITQPPAIYKCESCNFVPLNETKVAILTPDAKSSAFSKDAWVWWTTGTMWVV